MGRNPVFIVTDQCAAMKQAIPNCFKATDDFPASRHRLCMWHITEKFPAKLGNFLCKETEFMEKIKKYIWSSVIEPDEFEQGWKEVIKEFKLEEHVWLSEMYDMRQSWIPAYFRDKPMYGLIRTMSRFESENYFFSQFHQCGSTLSKFYIRFESAMDKQRNETKRLNHECASAKPVTVSKLFLEDDAAELYTRAIFYKIQEEILAARDDMRIQTIGPEINGMKCYEMKDVKIKDKIFQKPAGDITIHPPLQCKNKGSGLKRLRSEREKAVDKLKKKKRQCKLCNFVVHDKRTCPQNMKGAGAKVQAEVQTELLVTRAEVETEVAEMLH
ncbi:hypothetical protein POM88_052119 [Heracleum sosnowskyi]|uniref:MULE transposase domain-containing protein n=1 Tax=Heracleum sosnowskyi TaxID=360622 RepID=A0AAD8GSL5_9APIA|nr:hypothetical protein POM88_052119 [Heracleum sosnowskyi]